MTKDVSQDASPDASSTPLVHKPNYNMSSVAKGEWKPYLRFSLLVSGILFFFGIHNYMQEYIMSMPGYKIGVFLGFLEVFGVTVCTHVEREIDGEKTRKASWLSYIGLCVCLVVSSATSNIALAYINYPTKVVFRSCKLIPTIVISSWLNKKRVQPFEYVFGLFISMGMILFAIADMQVSPKFDPFGIVLVSISVCADAFLPNLQEALFDAGSSRIEVTYYTNLLTFVGMSVAFTATGDIQSAIGYAYNNLTCAYAMTAYTFVAYIAISFHMALVQEYGGITTVLVGNTRKALTICLSFFFFPKPGSWFYIYGGILVFGSLIGNGIMKDKVRRQKISKNYSTNIQKN